MPRTYKLKEKSTGNQTRSEPTSFDRAETIEELAKELIAEFHSHLVNANIAYLWKNKKITKSGRTVIATAEKCSPKVKALCDYDFIIVVSAPAYNDLTDKQRRAVIDHELEHCLVDDNDAGEKVTKIVAHDVEEFGSIILRHGLYKEDLVRMGRIVEKAEEQDDVVVRKGNDPIEAMLADREEDFLGVGQLPLPKGRGLLSKETNPN